ncbi:MAG: acyl-CoA/acyl-ACP dehydrogenase [Myxococcales bacterium]|nr:acyl-CoA/acyl-ACP dehydrogenase [Myxococcales bacterium]
MSSINEADFLASLERVAKVAATHAHAVDQQGRFPEETVEALRAEGLLGLFSATSVGGKGGTLRHAARAVERIGRECGSSAMVLCMHYCGTAVIEKFGDEATRREIAEGKHLSTLAFSEAGSRSHFWAPISTATKVDGGYKLDAHKSWITAASHATAYVWSSKPSGAEGASSIWLVSRTAKGLKTTAAFDGLGLRGNDSAPISAEGVIVGESARLGADGGGFDIMMGVVLPVFSLLNSACSVGLMEAAIGRAIGHITGTKHQHLNSSVADIPTVRAYVSKAKVRADAARALWEDSLAALEAGRADAQLRVLEVKALTNESALEVTDLAMRVCGGAAFRKENGVERAFRDARAGFVMAPTSDALYEFMGRALVGLPLF